MLLSFFTAPFGSCFVAVQKGRPVVARFAIFLSHFMQNNFSLTAALLLLASAQTSLGQTRPAPADTARHYQHHLGLTASP
ncbi:MAG: hypothetical protein JWP58_100 [Hymenobacter sp.]|nr:hypothetical protein [Hymenobacter sp.]